MNAVQRLHPECILCISRSKLQLIQGGNITNHAQIYAGVNTVRSRISCILFTHPLFVFQDSVLDSVQLESLNNNEIYLNLNVVHLLRVLKGCHYTFSVIVRLTKSNDIPCLQFFINGKSVCRISSPSTNQHTTQAKITQYIAVQVLLNSSVPIEPRLPDPEVYILMCYIT